MTLLTIEADDPIWTEKHKYYQDAPANNFHRPTTMVHTVTWVFLALYTDHQDCQNSEKEKVPQADSKYSICFKPFPAWCCVKAINPCNIIDR